MLLKDEYRVDSDWVCNGAYNSCRGYWITENKPVFIRECKYEEAYNRFVLTKKSTDECENNCIQHVYDAFIENGKYYVVFEVLNSECLLESFQKKLFSETEVINIIKNLATALSAMQKYGIIHLWVDLNHVYYDGMNAVLAEPWECVTEQGKILSNGSFVPLETYKLNQKLNSAVNVYSLGIVAVCLITGKIPPDAMSRLADNIEDLTENDDISSEFKTILKKCTALRSLYRYQNADEVLEELEKLKM